MPENDDKAQKDAEKKIAALEEQLDAAEKRAASADAKVAELEGRIAGLQATAPGPVPQRGTVTVDATGKEQ